MCTFPSGLDVVALDGPFAGVAVGPRQLDSGDGLAENEVPGSAGGSLLGPGCDVAAHLAPVADGLGPDGEGVADFLLQVVDKQHTLVDPLLDLLRVV